MEIFRRTPFINPARANARAASALPGNALTPSAFALARLHFHPDPLQSAILDSPAKRGILLCTRQWGKSTVLAAKAIHRAFTVPHSLILIASPGTRQSRLFLEKAAAFLARLDIRRRGDGGADASLLLPNRSRIVALPASEATIRGFSAPSMILIDEAARVPDPHYAALQPMLATSDGDLWLLSTPHGKSGFFYETWTHAPADAWARFSVTAPECPRIGPEFLERQRAELAAPIFRQEYLCEFLDSADAWFPRGLIESSLTDLEQPL